MESKYLNQYPPANLSEEEVNKLQRLESQLSQELNKSILLMAFEKSPE
ncbi:hypothetical protein [Aneurinibacillus terranovensis]|nr:hypothetical protein [Aneurinibacillus terranovensis]